jgi:hypothetical protein
MVRASLGSAAQAGRIAGVTARRPPVPVTVPGTAELHGVDFTCAPSRRKPIVVASGRREGSTLRIESIAELGSLDAFAAWLARPGPWVSGFDLPFGLPRAFVDANGLGATLAEVVATVHARCPTRMAWRAFIDAWGNAQPAGSRLLHRKTDSASPAVSTSPLQTRYVPVGFMWFEGLSRLVEAGVTLPGLHPGDPARVAVEAYPRRLAHALAARRSYKNTDDTARSEARTAMLAALETSGELLLLDRALRRSVLADPSGDRLDAVFCCVQAARAALRPNMGVPADVDPVEGWIGG